MKLHWGYGIWGAYIAFALGILFLVVRSGQNFAGLVSKDYYKLDLEYQGRADAIQRTRQLEQQPVLKLDEASHQLTLQLPAGHAAATGKLKLYRPSDPKADQLYEIAGADQVYPANQLQKGLYRAEINWQSEGLSYYFEQPVFVQP